MYKYKGKLNNEELRYIDPHKNKDENIKKMIIKECRTNLQYYADIITRNNKSVSLLLKIFLLGENIEEALK